MSRWTVQAIIACGLAANLSFLTAATPTIGVAISSGSVTVDHSLVPGNATLFDGNTVETGASSSRLQMKGGRLAILGADSEARVYGDHMVLDRGYGETNGTYRVEANTLNISGDARVAVQGRTVQVAALTAPVVVSTSTGIQVANLLPGRALAFTPQESGALATANLEGCVRKVGTVYLLTDKTSNVTVQLQGGGVEGNVKKAVKITGTPVTSGTPAGGASQVINVTNATVEGTCKAVFGSAAGPGAVAAAGAGVSTAAVVVAGVVVAAGLGVTAGVLATNNNTTVGPSCISPSAGCQ